MWAYRTGAALQLAWSGLNRAAASGARRCRSRDLTPAFLTLGQRHGSPFYAELY
jgi:hypothetical protein